MKKSTLKKGLVIGVLGLGITVGVAAQTSAMPGYTAANPWSASCQTAACHTSGKPAVYNTAAPAPTTPAPAPTTPAPATPAPTTPSTTTPAPTTPAPTTSAPAATLPQTGPESIYVSYLAGAGLLAPGIALLASRRKQR